jgi:NAD(P)-dependent dehydrogenase (short-subunit alcohol dehydrogenase family)
VADAGICSEPAAEEYTLEEFQENMDVNFNGAFHTAQAAAKIFKVQGFGNIVFTASVSANLVNTPQRQAAVGFSYVIVRSHEIIYADLSHVRTVQRIEG